MYIYIYVSMYVDRFCCDFGPQLAPSWGPKSLKNQSWRGSGEVLGRFFGVFFNLGVSWGHLGAFWRRLEASWEHLGASWERLGGVLGVLGSVLGPSWEGSWALRSTKIKKKNHSKKQSFF